MKIRIMRYIIPLTFGLFFFFLVDAQIKPTSVNNAVFFMHTAPLKDMKEINVCPNDLQSEEVNEMNDNCIFRNFEINKDDVLQSSFGYKKNIKQLINIEGIDNIQNKIPPDPVGDIGKEHYIQAVNMLFAVFDKEGNMIYGPASLLALWQEAPGIWSKYSNGDPMVNYDEAADRWIISELSAPYHPEGPYYIKIAVSETADPAGSWFLYGYEYSNYCDYPKFGVWHDGYYMSSNNNHWNGNDWDFHAVGVSVFERDSMLIGSPYARRVFFDLYPNQTPWSMLPADYDGTEPDEDEAEYLAYYKEGVPDRIFIFSVTTDWDIPENSHLVESDILYPASFSGTLPEGISQPDNAPYLSSMSNRLMYRLQYRDFGEYSSMYANHTINNGENKAGIRWYEFRKYTNEWEIQQQGTYSPDNTHRWMGSIASDINGNIALGYSVSDEHTYPSIRVTGRLKDDPPGIMTLEETEIIRGKGVQLSPYHRWGDYSCMSVDPENDSTFWYTQEYYEITGQKTWQTRIAAFDISEFSTNTRNSPSMSEIKIFPNPNDGTFSVQNLYGKNIRFYIYDISGKPIIEGRIHSKAEGSASFHIQGLSRGIYILRLINTEYIYTNKLSIR